MLPCDKHDTASNAGVCCHPASGKGGCTWRSRPMTSSKIWASVRLSKCMLTAPAHPRRGTGANVGGQQMGVGARLLTPRVWRQVGGSAQPPNVAPAQGAGLHSQPAEGHKKFPPQLCARALWGHALAFHRRHQQVTAWQEASSARAE